MKIATLKPTEQYRCAPREGLSHVFLTSAANKLNVEPLVFLKGERDVICFFLLAVQENDFFFLFLHKKIVF